jgi:hypothetical protein
MSKHNVNPNHYKVAGRDRQGEDILQARNKQKLAQSLARERFEMQQALPAGSLPTGLAAFPKAASTANEPQERSGSDDAAVAKGDEPTPRGSETARGRATRARKRRTATAAKTRSASGSKTRGTSKPARSAKTSRGAAKKKSAGAGRKKASSRGTRTTAGARQASARASKKRAPAAGSRKRGAKKR